MQIMDILDQLLLLRNEMILWSQQCTAQISLSIVEAVRTNVDVIERFDESGIAVIKEICQSTRVKSLEVVQARQEEFDNQILHIVASTPSLLKKFTKYFQSSTGRILMTTEMTHGGNDNLTIPPASFGENDTHLSTEHQVCSICLTDFQHDDRIVRNAKKRSHPNDVLISFMKNA